MIIPFYKYQGTGNDFIIIDNRKKIFDAKNTVLVKKLCDRRFGIGADGLMLLQEKKGFDFEMVYFNSDGSQSLCGNGSRCITRFASEQGIIASSAKFITTDGVHEALLRDGMVSLKMNDVSEIKKAGSDYFVNTGSPHYVRFVTGLEKYPVVEEGRKIRFSEPYEKNGTNVNFIEVVDNPSGRMLFVRTYERGVENETLSCGTGVTGCALVAHYTGNSTGGDYCKVVTPGGDLTVRFRRQGEGYTDIRLEGPATYVYKGEIEING